MNDEKLLQTLIIEAKAMENEDTPMLPGGRIKSMVTEVNRRRKHHQMRETALFLGIAFLLLCAEQALIRSSSLLFILLQVAMVGIGVVLFAVQVWGQKVEVRRHD